MTMKAIFERWSISHAGISHWDHHTNRNLHWFSDIVDSVTSYSMLLNSFPAEILLSIRKAAEKLMPSSEEIKIDLKNLNRRLKGHRITEKVRKRTAILRTGYFIKRLVGLDERKAGFSNPTDYGLVMMQLSLFGVLEILNPKFWVVSLPFKILRSPFTYGVKKYGVGEKPEFFDTQSKRTKAFENFREKVFRIINPIQKESLKLGHEEFKLGKSREALLHYQPILARAMSGWLSDLDPKGRDLLNIAFYNAAEILSNLDGSSRINKSLIMTYYGRVRPRGEYEMAYINEMAAYKYALIFEESIENELTDADGKNIEKVKEHFQKRYKLYSRITSLTGSKVKSNVEKEAIENSRIRMKNIEIKCLEYFKDHGFKITDYKCDSCVNCRKKRDYTLEDVKKILSV